ncbi:MAG TPA: response regulator [Ktedonobacteraceae bacterium]|jgi:chemotaxis protein histidine kinase CheA/ActR/RegA family two-component response regulator|nr:response regulator [Ktedonobacteraceae bacterium]
MSNTFDKLSVLDSFIEEVNSYLPEIEANLERLAQSPGDMEALEETYRRTHTIGGSASMMDFPGLAHVAHGMEDILSDVKDGLATLDQPTIELLQRSLARLYRLVDGIQHGIDENAVAAEDDEDYARYRAQQDAAAQSVPGGMITPEYAQQASGQIPVIQSPGISAAPSLDEMLASFRTPQRNAGEAAWPEEPVIRAEFPPRPEVQLPVPPMQPAQHAQFETPLTGSPPAVSQPSALEMLAGSNLQSQVPATPPDSWVSPTVSQMPPAPRPQIPEQAAYPPASSIVPPVPAQPAQPSLLSALAAWQEPADFPIELPQMPDSPSVPSGPLPSQSPGGTSVAGPANPSNSALFPQVYRDMQAETHALEAQVSSLQRTLSQLRLAASVIEAQRVEFKGFLDGSRDALDRMEDWAGKAMGLNLRNSPEQVRRYLPLSVMWVANSKLKKILDMLLQMASGAEGTQEQIQMLLQHLQASIATCGEILQKAADSPEGMVFTHEAGWTAWDMQVSSDPRTLRERVTFEREGDLAALRAQIEAQLREELRLEYENRPAALAARAEMERQIREELREEFNATQQLQASVSGVNSPESLQELERRLRNEIEIEVRREFLSQLTGGEGSVAAAQMQMEMQTPPINLVAPSTLPPFQPAPTVLSPSAVPSSTFSSTGSSAMSGDFGEEAADIFRLEAEEHLQTISMHVAALEQAPTDLEPIQGIRRATHTLKGAAGMMGFRAIADLCHISEDMLDGIMEGSISISPTVLSLILDTAEALDSLVNSKDASAQNESAVQSLRTRYAELLGEQSSLTSPVIEEIEIEEEREAMSVPLASEVHEEEAHFGGPAMPGAARADLSVRVSLSKLDELVNLFGELLVNRSILEERIQRLNRLVADAGVSSARLRDVGQKLESRFEAATLPSGHSVQVMPGDGDPNLSSLKANGKNGRTEPAHLKEFDELELDRYTEFHQLARGLSEGIADMTTLSSEMESIIRDCESSFGRESRLSTTFQDRLMKARLVPLSTMIPRLYRTARAVALKQRKEFDLVLEGQETEVDRTVIEEIAGPLLHLMRNAVNHAIETPEVRQQRGKPSAGQIKLSASYEGNQVVITVRDDGTGLDPERIRNEAINRGLIRPNQVLSDNEIIELIFRPGFSTAEVLSEESGRGVGLDVVRDSVARLRGTIEVETTPGQGTAFTMKFPTSLAIQNAMMVQVADQQFAIPTVMVESIGRLDNFKHTNYGGRPAILVQNQPYPLSSLAQLLGLPIGELNDRAPLLLVRTDRHRVALVVDDIKGRMDVVIKNLGPHLRSVHGVAGGTVLGNGRVVLILELLELLSVRSGLRSGLTMPSQPDTSTTSEFSQIRSVQLERRTTIAPTAPAQRPVETPSRGKHILVVDDSPSVRRVVSNMLKQHQWEVQTARDGVEALEMITQQTPAAVLLDIEMPRMDGYELMATIRAQEQYRTLPLVVLTSRAAAKHQQHAMQLGASAYVVKPYQDEELINILNALVYGATV